MRPTRRSCRTRAAVVALTAVAAIGCHHQAVESPANLRLDDERIAKIEAILEAQWREQHIPGLSFAIVQDDQAVYLKALGLRDIERKLPATPDTVFPIGSCTKAFTSMAVGISQDHGLLSLDDPPRKYLPYFKLADPEADAQVTLRDMLSHRTGLKAKADLAAEPAVLNREEFVRAATSAKPAAKFRSTFQYSNAMFSAVGEIVGKANGSTWERVIETRIFEPLAMTSSFVSAHEAAKAADHATGYIYVSENETWRPVQPPRSLEVLAPGGSIVSSARDMTQWLRMLAAGGRLDGKQIVAEATLRDLTAAHIPIDATLSYALGWVTYDWNGLRVVEHNGGSQGMSALVSFIPERHVGFVFLANTSPNFMTMIGNAGKLLWPLILGETVPSYTPPPTAPGASAPPISSPSSEAAPAEDLPSVDVLLARMVDAIGGERNLRRHTSEEAHALKSYANHGVAADLTIWAKAPGMRTEEEVWTAAGKEIGRLRIYFDGVRGGQETTFGQDALNDSAANDRARRDNAFHDLLDLKHLYEDIRIQSRTKVGPEDAYVLQLTPSQGPAVLLYVSVRTALVLKRDTEGTSMTFDEYRAVDGELVPYRTTIQDALGETTIQIKKIRFNTSIPADAFAPMKR